MCFRYVPPPPSQHRYNDYSFNIFDPKNYPKNQPKTQYQQNIQQQNQIISYPTHNNIQQVVHSLAVKYIPNYGYKYYAIIPANYQLAPIVALQTQAQQKKLAYLNSNDVIDKPNKQNENYNSKLKKYKAYEESKFFVPYPNNVSKTITAIQY